MTEQLVFLQDFLCLGAHKAAPIKARCSKSSERPASKVPLTVIFNATIRFSERLAAETSLQQSRLDSELLSQVTY